MDPLFGIAAAVAVVGLGTSPVVRTLLAHTLRHPRSETVILVSNGGKVISAKEPGPSTREAEVASAR